MSIPSIHFHIKDFNLSAIRHEAKLGPSMASKYRYFIYGLKNTESNYPIEIETGNKIVLKTVQRVTDLFTKNGVQCMWRGCAGSKYPLYTPYTIYVGLRRDLREDVSFCVAAIQTIILGIEGRVTIEPRFKIPNVPKVKKTEQPKVSVVKKKEQSDANSAPQQLLDRINFAERAAGGRRPLGRPVAVVAEGPQPRDRNGRFAARPHIFAVDVEEDI